MQEEEGYNKSRKCLYFLFKQLQMGMKTASG